MKQMPVLWKRLIKSGETCTRCENTGRELRSAVARLATVLQPLGIAPVLETQALDEAAFKSNPSESNRVWIAGTPIEEWLGAAVEMTRCCSVCGDSDCRALTVSDRTFETIPEDQFIKAGLMAASRMITVPPASKAGPTSCGACGKNPV